MGNGAHLVSIFLGGYTKRRKTPESSHLLQNEMKDQIKKNFDVKNKLLHAFIKKTWSHWFKEYCVTSLIKN